MADDEIRNFAVQYARDIANGSNLVSVKDKDEFLSLAADIADFIKNGPAAP